MKFETPKHPDPFLEVRVEKLDLQPSLIGWCAGFENGEWRSDLLAKHLVKWLPEFALRYSEWKDLSAHDAVELVGKAAKSVYTSTKYKNRGELGEILLHAMIRQKFKSIPAISKYFYKDSNNDTVKGFDAVHVVQDNNNFELWLGEVKFYNEVTRAIRDVVKELKDHSQRDYLRSEFTAITNKLDDKLSISQPLKDLLHPNNSLDKIFKQICIPVLLTYNSEILTKHSEICAEYENEFETELLQYRDKFAENELPDNVVIHLFLFPLQEKDILITKFDEVLKACQNLS
jgi:Cap4 SAVED domain